MARESVPPDMMQDLDLIYEGSVKRVWRPAEIEDRLWFEYTDDYSLFGWREMPDRIANRAKSLSILGAFLFEHLADPKSWEQLPVAAALKPFRSDWLDARWAHLIYSHVFREHGVPTHYQGLVGADGSPISFAEAAKSKSPIYLAVLPALAARPESYQLLGQKIFYYPPADNKVKRRLISLDVIFHFGLTAADPLADRLATDDSYRSALGLTRQPQAGEIFERPVLEFFTKFEPAERRLSVQEALLISGLTPGQFEELVEMSYAVALCLYVFFASREIELWQGKLAFAVAPDGLILVDSLEPDEMRLVYKDARLSKHFVERFYQGSPWQEAIKQAQDKAAASGRPDWQDICRSKLKVEPEPLPAPLKKTLDHLYGTLTNHIVARQLFDNQPSLDELAVGLKSTTRI